MWELRLKSRPKRTKGPDGKETWEDQWVDIYAQGVPPHIGHPKEDYETDPYADFLPPIVADYDPDIEDESYDPPYRAVVIVQEGRHQKEGQRYVDPVLVISGEEYRKIPFQEMLARIYEGIRDPEDPNKEGQK